MNEGFLLNMVSILRFHVIFFYFSGYLKCLLQRFQESLPKFWLISMALGRIFLTDHLKLTASVIHQTEPLFICCVVRSDCGKYSKISKFFCWESGHWKWGNDYLPQSYRTKQQAGQQYMNGVSLWWITVVMCWR